MSDNLVTKQDVVLAVANILLRLGKNDFDGTRRAFDIAHSKFDEWMATRPEKQVIAILESRDK